MCRSLHLLNKGPKSLGTEIKASNLRLSGERVFVAPPPGEACYCALPTRVSYGLDSFTRIPADPTKSLHMWDGALCQKERVVFVLLGLAALLQWLCGVPWSR